MTKKRIDSATAQVEVMKAGAIPVHPPSHVPLSDADMPFFANVIDEFARSEWSAHQLELAAMLARIMSDLNTGQQDLRREGLTTKSDRGTPVANPLVTIVKGLTGDILSMRRSLALHARARNGGDSRNKAGRSAKAKEIEAASPLGDNLLARPN